MRQDLPTLMPRYTYWLASFRPLQVVSFLDRTQGARITEARTASSTFLERVLNPSNGVTFFTSFVTEIFRAFFCLPVCLSFVTTVSPTHRRLSTYTHTHMSPILLKSRVRLTRESFCKGVVFWQYCVQLAKIYSRR